MAGRPKGRGIPHVGTLADGEAAWRIRRAIRRQATISVVHGSGREPHFTGTAPVRNLGGAALPRRGILPGAVAASEALHPARRSIRSHGLSYDMDTPSEGIVLVSAA